MRLYRSPSRGTALAYLSPCIDAAPLPAGSPSTAGAPRVTRFGASQLVSPQIHLVFDHEYPHPERFLEWHIYHCLTGLVSGSFAQGLRQYGSGPGVYAGYATPSFPSGTLSSDGLLDWLVQALEAGSVAAGGVDQLVMLFPGPATIIGEPGFVYGVDWCAYHGSVELPPALRLLDGRPQAEGVAIGQSVAFAVLPYPGLPPACGQALGLSELEILTVLASHELAEAMTDAVPGEGWTGSDGEIDDFAPCLWRPMNVAFDGWTYKIQAYWDQGAGRCWQPAPATAAPVAPFGLGLASV